MNFRNKMLGVFLLATLGFALTGDSAEAQSNSNTYGESRSKVFANNFGATRYGSKFLLSRLNPVGRDRSAFATMGALNGNNRSSSAPRSNFSSKPFSNVSRSPAVSPYLGLSSAFNQANSYYNTVRPQQEQRRVNQQLQRQGNANQSRLNQMAAQGPYSVKGNENSAPTGHAAVFQSMGNYLNTGGYFAGATQPRPKPKSR